MASKKRLRRLALALLGGACLFSGPCGITTLQFQDFLTSTVIRTSVTTLASVIEAATVADAQDTGADQDEE